MKADPVKLEIFKSQLKRRASVPIETVALRSIPFRRHRSKTQQRSYLGKAFSHAGDYTHAAKELELAKRFDPRDPTAWLYSALLDRQQNRINEGVRELQRSDPLAGLE